MIELELQHWVWIAVLPLAFLHGYWVGRKAGIIVGADGMFEKIFDMGDHTSDPNKRIVELTKEYIDDDERKF